MSLFISCIFYYVWQIRKTCYRKKWKTKPGELSSWFWLTESLKMTCARPCAWFLKFLSSRGGLDCFSQPSVLPKHCKITVACLKSLKWTSRVNFNLPKVGRMTINFELLKVSKITSLKIYSSHGEGRNIKLEHQLNFIQRLQVSPLPKEVVMSLPHNHVILTNLFISSYRGATVIKFGQ